MFKFLALLDIVLSSAVAKLSTDTLKMALSF